MTRATPGKETTLNIHPSHARGIDPQTHELRASSRRLTRAIAFLATKLARSPDEAELADALQMSVPQYRRELGRIAETSGPMLDLVELDPHELGVIVAELPRSAQVVLALVYSESCTLAEVASIVGCTDARAKELHIEAAHRVRAALLARDEILA